jgi:hypothetical protein
MGMSRVRRTTNTAQNREKTESLQKAKTAKIYLECLLLYVYGKYIPRGLPGFCKIEQ